MTEIRNRPILYQIGNIEWRDHSFQLWIDIFTSPR